MTLHLYIERLVLDGLPVTPGDAGTLQRAVERELAARLAVDNAARDVISSTAIAALTGGTIQYGPRISARSLGTGIGQAIYGAFAHSTSGNGGVTP